MSVEKEPSVPFPHHYFDQELESKNRSGSTVIPRDDGLMDLFACGEFMDCWIIDFEFKKTKMLDFKKNYKIGISDFSLMVILA